MRILLQIALNIRDLARLFNISKGQLQGKVRSLVNEIPFPAEYGATSDKSSIDLSTIQTI